MAKQPLTVTVKRGKQIIFVLNLEGQDANECLGYLSGKIKEVVESLSE